MKHARVAEVMQYIALCHMRESASYPPENKFRIFQLQGSGMSVEDWGIWFLTVCIMLLRCGSLAYMGPRQTKSQKPKQRAARVATCKPDYLQLFASYLLTGESIFVESRRLVEVAIYPKL